MNGTVTVPVRTPFVLDVDAYDPNEPTVTYSWEQFDLGTASPPEGDDGSRPLFRVYPPSTTSWRSFPSEKYVLYNANEPPDTVGCGGFICLSGESLPETTRSLHFRVMLRDGEDGVTIAETVVNTDAGSGPFEVTQPTGSTYWTEGTRKTVTWNPANTQNAPVSCQNVRILLSTDGGSEWPYVLAGSTPNDGAEAVTLPFHTTGIARIKVEAVGNVFYDVSPGFIIEPLRVTNTNDSGRGSLRQAILDANDWPDGGTIPLQIPGSGVRTIQVLSQLPTILKPVVLDGWELGGPEYVGPPLLELVGSSCPEPQLGVPCDGLVVQGDNGFLNGLIVRNFAGNGIVLRGAGAYANHIWNSYIGTNAAGTAAAGNGRSGILIDGGYPDPLYRNVINQNVISGNQVGVSISGVSANGNAVLLNKIGTDATGTVRIPNLDDGVRIVGAPNTIVGQPGDGNVISGNGTVLNGFVNRQADAIDVSGATASGTSIRSNIIGLDAAGTSPLYNTSGGIRIVDAPNTLVGGTAAGARNVVGDDGTINYNAAHCILVQGTGATGTVIQGNHLGTDVTGTLDRGCRGAGVYLENAHGVQIGGTTPAARNVISGNNNYGGIWSANGSSGAVIQGNYIGTDVTGMSPQRANGTVESQATGKVEAKADVRQGASLDGTMIYIRGEAWKELKVGCFFEVEQAPTLDPETMDWIDLAHARKVTFVSHLGGPELFGRKMWTESKRRHWHKAIDTQVVGDGAVWIWNLVADYFYDAHQVVDWYHATEHLAIAAHLAFGEGTPEAARWFKQQETPLFQGHADRVAQTIRLWLIIIPLPKRDCRNRLATSRITTTACNIWSCVLMSG